MNPFRILVVDDEQEIREFLQEGLKYAGYEVAVAEDGDVAFDQVKSFMPDLILLDVMLPNQTGIDVFKKIREIDKRVMVVMISGMLDLSIAKEAMKLGALEYVTKPIQLQSLMDYIADLQEQQTA